MPVSPCVPVLQGQTVVDSTLPRSLDHTATDGVTVPQGRTPLSEGPAHAGHCSPGVMAAQAVIWPHCTSVFH